VYSGETAAQMISRKLSEVEEKGYGLVSFSECGGLEVTTAGKIFSVCTGLAVLYMIFKPATDKMVAFGLLLAILGTLFGLYRLRGRVADRNASVPL
jgi:hypothetical protein